MTRISVHPTVSHPEDSEGEPQGCEDKPKDLPNWSDLSGGKPAASEGLLRAEV